MKDPLDVIKLLLRRGVDIHARDTKGDQFCISLSWASVSNASRWTVSYMSSLSISVQRQRCTTLSYLHRLWLRGSNSLREWRHRCHTTTFVCLDTGRQSRSKFGGQHVYQSRRSIAMERRRASNQMIHDPTSLSQSHWVFLTPRVITAMFESLELPHYE